jgi:PiT family inorganic phosphate transporter
MTLTLFILVVVLALIFGITNGFIDGGSLVATVITTRALAPGRALMLVAVCEMVGIYALGRAVTQLLGLHLVDMSLAPQAVEALAVLGAGLLAALLWNTSMWWMALPSSSSHALVGGLVGAVLMAYGPKAIFWPMFLKIFLYLGLVPVAGALLSGVLAKVMYWIGGFFVPALEWYYRGLQILALAGLSLVHGSNDGQKSMAMMLLAFLALPGMSRLDRLPWWAVLLCGSALASGVIFGSRRVIRTVGARLYRVEPLQGFCAGTSAMLLVGASCRMGYPMSTTHVMSTSVLGAGAAVHPRGVRWDLVGEISLVWLVTIPAAGCVAALLAAGAIRILHVVP